MSWSRLFVYYCKVAGIFLAWSVVGTALELGLHIPHAWALIGIVIFGVATVLVVLGLDP